MKLLYADDMANLADTDGKLQQHINLLESFCNSYVMKVNLRTTKIMIFRGGGITTKNEKWLYANVEIFNQYKYLGMWFTPTLSWWKTRRHLAQQAKKSIHFITTFY